MIRSGDLTAKVKADYQLGQRIPLDHTPTIYIVSDTVRGQPFVEVIDRTKLYQLIEQVMKETRAAIRQQARRPTLTRLRIPNSRDRARRARHQGRAFSLVGGKVGLIPRDETFRASSGCYDRIAMPDKATVQSMPPLSSHDRILMAGKHLFARNGYENTSTVAISREAGTSESQMMKHFGSKQGLLVAIFDRGWVTIAERVQRPRRTLRSRTGSSACWRRSPSNWRTMPI